MKPDRRHEREDHKYFVEDNAYRWVHDHPHDQPLIIQQMLHQYQGTLDWGK